MGISKCLQKYSSHLLPILTFALSTSFKNNEVALFFQTSDDVSTPRIRLQIQPVHTLKEAVFLEVVVQGKAWKVAALHTLCVGELMAELSMREDKLPSILLVQDKDGTEYVLLRDANGKASLNSKRYFFEHDTVIQKSENGPVSLCIAADADS